MLTELLVVCSFIFPCRTWFSAQVNLVSGTESFRCIRGLDDVLVLAIAYPLSQRQELLQGCLGQADSSLHLPSECQLSWQVQDTLLTAQGSVCQGSWPAPVTSGTMWE